MSLTGYTPLCNMRPRRPQPSGSRAHAEASRVKTVAIIPARLSATRLPGKPLADLLGRPMIVHVIERVRRARGLSAVCVATDDPGIAAVSERAGARVVMTSPHCATGTDRVAEAALALDVDFILNVQGDEPLLPPEAVEALREALEEGAPRGIELATLARPLEPGEALFPQVVKVVLAEDGTALYFSRSVIPFPRDGSALVPLAHVGLYGYTRAALARLASLAPTRLERAEGLEQLRALGHGLKMAVRVGPWKTQAVDTPEDLERVRALLRTQTPGTSGA